MLLERLEEEINRAGRQGTALSCLLVSIEDLEQIEREHGRPLSKQTLEYVGLTLRRELRRFDRVGAPSERELLVVLPGADAPRGEIVARRALARLHVIKIEAAGRRRPLRVAVMVTAWRAGMSAQELVDQSRAAAMRWREGDPGISGGEPARTGGGAPTL
ncbi:MAG TPA: diguanylate cyclase [Solirubrobacteraceae bacterium]|nr:diguanylate cyclase [Solirubrobacteraceae bacterium]